MCRSEMAVAVSRSVVVVAESCRSALERGVCRSVMAVAVSRSVVVVVESCRSVVERGVCRSAMAVAVSRFVVVVVESYRSALVVFRSEVEMGVCRSVMAAAVCRSVMALVVFHSEVGVCRSVVVVEAGCRFRLVMVAVDRLPGLRQAQRRLPELPSRRARRCCACCCCCCWLKMTCHTEGPVALYPVALHALFCSRAPAYWQVCFLELARRHASNARAFGEKRLVVVNSRPIR